MSKLNKLDVFVGWFAILFAKAETSEDPRSAGLKDFSIVLRGAEFCNTVLEPRGSFGVFFQ